MAQTEDTELRDLVIEALEKNGSLAKVRALLRANIFLAFEDEFENAKHNPNLDNILHTPEGLFSLSLIHEYLEYCNLRNTMFVYVSETRQGKEYSYEGRKRLAEKLTAQTNNLAKEPLLISVIKSYFKSQKIEINNSYFRRSFASAKSKNGVRDDQNCTYIVHEDSSSASSHSQSQSDNSSDEKNKLLLKLPLDNSDTDTSSDSTRDKSSSEYIANENIVGPDSDNESKKSNTISPDHKLNEEDLKDNKGIIEQFKLKLPSHIHSDLLNPSHVSSDSTSYLEIQAGKKPIYPNAVERMADVVDSPGIVLKKSRNFSQNDSRWSFSGKHANSIQDNNNVLSVVASVNNDDPLTNSVTVMTAIRNQADGTTTKPDVVTSDYSFDFSPSPRSSPQTISNKDALPQAGGDYSLNITFDHPKEDSHSSRSSVSISDVADLIDNSHISESLSQHRNSKSQSINISDNNIRKPVSDSHRSGNVKSPRDESEEYSGSSIPSLSNLSLDFHSD